MIGRRRNSPRRRGGGGAVVNFFSAAAAALLLASSSLRWLSPSPSGFPLAAATCPLSFAFLPPKARQSALRGPVSALRTEPSWAPGRSAPRTSRRLSRQVEASPCKLSAKRRAVEDEKTREGAENRGGFAAAALLAAAMSVSGAAIGDLRPALASTATPPPPPPPQGLEPGRASRSAASLSRSFAHRAPSLLDDRGLLLSATTGGDAAPEGGAASTLAEDDEDNPLDEVWTIVDKYYVNKPSNTKWSSVLEEYRPKFDRLVAKKTATVEEQLELVGSMVATLGDKYSRILTPAQYADIQKFDLLGVGVTLMPVEGRIVVGAPPIAGSASARAGLRAGDVILRVNGVPTAGKTALDIIDQISESPGAPTLTLSVLPRDRAGAEEGGGPAAGGERSYDVTLDRTLHPVKDPIQYELSNGGTVGYVRISEFNSLVLPKLEEALAALRPSAREGLVLDLRQNTGGAFQSAVEIASLLLEDGKVAVYVVDNTDQTTPFRTSSKVQSGGTAAVDRDVPVVVWMDGRTASASEVLASALHDNCRAVLAGGNSFGKGLIQAVYGLKNGGGLVLTVARYVTPNGSSIQGTGLAPDVPGHVSPTVLGIPISTDTSSVDWTDVRRRLSLCQAPA